MGTITRNFANQIKTGGKLDADGLDLTDTFAFTGTVTGAAANTPAFFASVTADQTLSHDTFTKIAFANEVFDVGGVYDNSTNYRFTPGFVGKSFIASTIFASDAESNLYAHSLYLRKNGSTIVYHQVETGSTGETFKQNIISLNGVFAHDADDYFEVFGEPYTSDSGTVHYPTGSGTIFKNSFYGFKIIE